MPAQLLSILNADMVFSVLTYRDIVEAGHHLHDWEWGAAPFIFPDLAVTWMLNFLGVDGLSSLQLLSGLYFAGWIALPALLFRLSGGRRLEIFVGCVTVFCVAIARGWLPGLLLHYFMFAPTLHAGGNLTALACLALVQAIRLHGWRWSLTLLLAVLGLLAALSDALTLVVFTVPTLGALTMQAFRERTLTSRDIGLAALVAVSTGVGFFAERFLPNTPAGGMTSLNLPVALPVVGGIAGAANFGNPPFLLSLVFQADIVVGCLLLWRKKPKPALASLSDAPPSSFFFLMAFAALLIISNWGAAVLTGNYLALNCNRYVMTALVCPVFFLAGVVAQAEFWTGGSRTAFSVLISAAIAASSFFLPAPSAYFAGAEKAVPEFRALMVETRSDAGLADYWDSNMIRFLSHSTIPMGEIDEVRGTARAWFTNRRWYLTDGKSGSVPTYGFLLTARENLGVIRDRYGSPRRVEKTALGDVWVYGPTTVFRCDPVRRQLEIVQVPPPQAVSPSEPSISRPPPEPSGTTRAEPASSSGE